MIGHDDEGIKLYIRKPHRKAVPRSSQHASRVAEMDDVVRRVAEQASAILRANGDEIRSSFRVVVVLQPHRTATMRLRVIDHAPASATDACVSFTPSSMI